MNLKNAQNELNRSKVSDYREIKDRKEENVKSLSQIKRE
jgi:hypothetical protein